jgi:hypothetical protein
MTVRFSRDVAICEAPLAQLSHAAMSTSLWTSVWFSSQASASCRRKTRDGSNSEGDEPLRDRPGSGPAQPCRLQHDRVFDYALQTITDVRYGDCREYDPEDTVRFHALRMQHYWRFVKELKRELKV